jgi:hypothetical protein
LKQVAFLGHILSKGGISVDPSKVQDVLSWNVPTSINNIQSFLRLVGYYRRFIEGSSKISKPMTELLEKDKKFKWAPAYEATQKRWLELIKDYDLGINYHTWKANVVADA